jgi:hypothetical protein
VRNARSGLSTTARAIKHMAQTGRLIMALQARRPLAHRACGVIASSTSARLPRPGNVIGAVRGVAVAAPGRGPLALALPWGQHRHSAPPAPPEPVGVSPLYCRRVSSLYCSHEKRRI